MNIDLDEIGDRSVENAVGDVASGAAKEKGESGGVKGADIAASDEQPRNDSDDGEGAADEKHAQGGGGETGEKTEGDAGVAGVNEIEKIVNDGERKVVAGAGFDPGLCCAVEKDDGDGEPEEAEARGKSHEVKEVWEVRETEEMNTSSHRDACGSVVFDFGEGFRAALADLWVAWVLTNMDRVVPAALAFGAVGAVDLDRQARQ